MERSSAFLHPESYPCLIATAPTNKPSPKIDLSIPIVSLLILIESRCKILSIILSLNQSLMKPSALPSSCWVAKLVAVTLKKGPKVLRWSFMFWLREEAINSDIEGMGSLLQTVGLDTRD
ncbi:hypothetical protein AMTR_s00086p00036940 [Amborella trichopoda]|uniref:Uncharacterized protein n=1 Tax=Amborella trichopoda TaxID=13333 RepID=W1P4B8_AMBTC|nr:hypothetical protein AMTR_s00086p00036940 [Amborella trichopoda]